jgi:hypothetical protein
LLCQVFDDFAVNRNNSELLVYAGKEGATAEIQVYNESGQPSAFWIDAPPAPGRRLARQLHLKFLDCGKGSDGLFISSKPLDGVSAASAVCHLMITAGFLANQVWAEYRFPSLASPLRELPKSLSAPLMEAEAAKAVAPHPPLRLIRTAREAEEVAAEWMCWLGFSNAVPTHVGRDEGIDVVAANAVAQVKMEGVPTGRPVIQGLFGVAAGERKQGLFFSLAGYTVGAVEWAERVGLALFTFDYQGQPVPFSSAAQLLFASGGRPTDP